MHIRKLIIKNFKSLQYADIALNPHLNIIVGDNEAGKSTFLEAINLVLSSQLNGRNIQNELSPYVFNDSIVNKYLSALKNGNKQEPPSILIEAYFDEDESLEKFKGTNNSLKENCAGVKLSIEINEEFQNEFNAYINSSEPIRILPVEYYTVKWYSFAGNPISAWSTPIKSIFIDTSQVRVANGTDKYISKIISNVLDAKQRADLSVIYRKMKDVFGNEDGVQKINENLAAKKGDISDKDLSVSLDMSSNSGWESSLTAHLNEIPFYLAGKGEQSSVKMKLAMESSDDAHVFLVEEPENHLSYPNVNRLIGKISEKTSEKQIVIATHSSFVLNKLGIENVILFNRGKALRLNNLTPDTQDYFMKLPGHDTLRLILSKKAILVEGASDELIVQKAFYKKHGKKPLECGVDVISVQSLAFKRFLEIGVLLDLCISVVTDNDGKIEKLEKKYSNYLSLEKISIHYDLDERFNTLEPQLLKANSLEKMNEVLEKEFENEEELLNFMQSNKTDCALKIFNSPADINFPEYIENAIAAIA